MRLFSTWGEVVDPAAEKLLAPTGWVRPDAAAYPTGGDWAEHYLQPLADALGDRVRYGATVTGVSRAGRDRIVDAGRERAAVHRARPVRRRRARSGSPPARSSTRPAPGPPPVRLGADGLPALGEKAAAEPHLLPRPRPQRPCRTRPLRGQAHRRHRLRRLRLHRARLLADLAKEDGTGTHAVWILRRGIGGEHLRRRRGRPASRPRRAGPARQGRRRGRARRRGHRIPYQAVDRDGDGDRLVLVARGRPPSRPGRRGHRPHRLPPRPVLPLRAPPRPRRAPPGPDRAGPADRPERPLLRHRLPARRAASSPTPSRVSTWSA